MTRARLTITLEKQLLKYLDGYIKKSSQLRNRSHAIETILGQTLSPKISKVVILAGGQGVKMRPFTYELPKSMIPFRGRPLLEYTLNFLKKFNLTDIVLATGYLSDKIKQYFGDGSRFGVRINYSEEKKPQGTAGALYLARPFLQNNPFLVLHSDILTKIDLNDFANFSSQQRGVGTLALNSTKDPVEFGVVQLKGNQIVEFAEKPKLKKDLSHLISTGIYYFTPKIFEFLDKKTSSLEHEIFPKLTSLSLLSGYLFEGWIDISTPQKYEWALKNWKD